jgi:RNA polymerase-binding transcription factor DksA
VTVEQNQPEPAQAPAEQQAEPSTAESAEHHEQIEAAQQDEVPVAAPGDDIDLDAMTADLDGVDAALVRLADGTYWTDEVTGEPIPPEVLAADPIARRS